MNDKMFWVIMGCLLTGCLIGFEAGVMVQWRPPYLDDWQCTASHVTKDTLPREEECTQYTKKEKE